ncbi:exported hypothetical protein [Verrucomicrobia bacterium]|nr:exported hypothetical protein [Verrucomicrobiota bacterium]
MNLKTFTAWVAISAVAPSAAPGQVIYSVTDLGTLGGTYAVPSGINDNGQVVGSSSTTNDTTTNAFLYSGGKMANLGTLGGWISHAYAINNSGQVVGDAQTTNLLGHPFLYSGGKMTDLGMIGSAFSINDSGQVVGEVEFTYLNPHAFLYSGSTMTDLGTFGGSYSCAYGISNSGQIVGTAENIVNHEDIFVYRGGVMADLGWWGAGLAINTNEQVVGSASYSGAFLYSGGNITLLGTASFAATAAYAINNSGQVVGVAFTNSTITIGPRAFLYSGGTLLDLNNLADTNTVGTLEAAYGINDSGQIIAQSQQGRAYLLSLAVPTNSGMSLLWARTSLPALGEVLVLAWTNPLASLQFAPAVTGPYTNVPGATSPYVASTSGPQRFFRLQANQ